MGEDEGKGKEDGGLVKVDLSDILSEEDKKQKPAEKKAEEDRAEQPEPPGGDDGGNKGNSSKKSKKKKEPSKRERFRKWSYVGVAIGMFYLGGQYSDKITQYIFGTVNEIQTTVTSAYNNIVTSTKRGINEQVSRILGYTGENNVQRIATENDVLTEAINLINGGNASQETLNSIVESANKHRNEKEVYVDALEVTYEIINNGKINKKGLLDLRKTINAHLDSEALLSETIDYIAADGTPEESRIQIAREAYKTLAPENQSEMAVYFVSVIGDDGKRDATIAAIMPQLSTDGKKKIAKNLAVDAVDALNKKVEELCEDNSLCKGLAGKLEMAREYVRSIIEDKILEDIDNIHNYFKY